MSAGTPPASEVLQPLRRRRVELCVSIGAVEQALADPAAGASEVWVEPRTDPAPAQHSRLADCDPLTSEAIRVPRMSTERDERGHRWR